MKNGHGPMSRIGKRGLSERDVDEGQSGLDMDEDEVDNTGASTQHASPTPMAARKRLKEDNYHAQGGAVANFVSRQYVGSMHQAGSSKSGDEPSLEILEQPRARGFRFRYPCEGPCHGELRGENSEPRMKSYPSVKLNNVQTRARILVSLVCHDDPVRPHAHCLVGKNVQAGQCSVEVGRETNWTAAFPRLSILHIPKKNAARVLLERYALMKDSVSALNNGSSSSESKQAKEEADSPLDKTKYDDKMALELQLLPGAREQLSGGAAALAALNEEERHHLEECAAEQARTMNLNVVRLCFQAFLPDASGAFTRPLTSKLSHPVYDTKASSSSALRICRIDRHSGSALGGDVIFMLCDRVQKDDITIRFFEERTSENARADRSESDYQWEADGEFSVNDVHRQSAIVFKTPPYWQSNISRPVKVWIALKRKSEEEFGEPHPFTYLPADACTCSCKGSNSLSAQTSVAASTLQRRSISVPNVHTGVVERPLPTPVMSSAPPVTLTAGASAVTSPVIANPANGMYYFYPSPVGLPPGAMAMPGTPSPFTGLPSVGLPFYPAPQAHMVACNGTAQAMMTTPAQIHPALMACGMMPAKPDLAVATK